MVCRKGNRHTVISHLGVVVFDTVEDAAEYLVRDLMGVFWRA